MSINSMSPSNEILNSWKEIACYLNRGVRTVQRWEADLGLPVRRPRGKSRSAVVAMRSEIDLWVKSCPLEREQELRAENTPLPMIRSTRESTRELLLMSQKLRHDVSHTRLQLSIAVTELVANLGKMVERTSSTTSCSALPGNGKTAA